MNRRDALRQLAIFAGTAFTSSFVKAALAGAPLHVPPQSSLLTAAQREMIAQLSDLIIPTTDTPGAITAGVPAFIDQILSSWYGDQERHAFLAGMAAVDADCMQKFGRDFAKCDTSERTVVLAAAEAQATGYKSAPFMGAFEEPQTAAPFFYQIKQLTVLGYYTSEIGATQELSYNPIPGRYDGDVDFASTGRQWSS